MTGLLPGRAEDPDLLRLLDVERFPALIYFERGSFAGSNPAGRPIPPWHWCSHPTGVVTNWVKRKDKVTVDGVEVNPNANISTNIEFKPIEQGPRAAVIPDFSMTAEQVTPVITLMRTKLGWYQGCLYNQEIGETPQFFFDHMVKSGDAYELAKEIRQGLDLTESH